MRTNGFEKPFSKDQVTSWILQPLLMSCFIAFVAKLLDRDKCLAILLPNAALILIVLSSWTICELRDPAASKSSTRSSLACIRVPPKVTRYCTICCKNSPGLDHHCTWLNTCIGENNYEAFYCLVVSATIQTLLQAVIGILMATLWFSQVKAQVSSDWHQPMLVLLWIHNAICLSLANSYFLLAGFHTYLLWIGSGTYDFILANGSDGLCARMLKCRCLRRSKKGNKLGHVANDGSKPKTGNAKSKTSPSGQKSKDPPAVAADEAAKIAAANAAAEKKKQEMEQWKEEWLRKYGADDDDQANENTKNTVSTSEKGSSAAVSDDAKSAQLAVGKVSARRASTYPAEHINSASSNTTNTSSKPSVGESQITMSIGVNESEDIFDEVDLDGDDMTSEAETRADNVSSGPKTDL